MNNNTEQILGHDYAALGSPLSRFIDEQQRLIEKAQVEIMNLKNELNLIEKESDYWKSECEKVDAQLRKNKVNNDTGKRFIPVEPAKWVEMVQAIVDVKKLNAEYERIIRAGDDLADTINCEHMRAWREGGNEGEPPMRHSVKLWLAAKKERDAK